MKEYRTIKESPREGNISREKIEAAAKEVRSQNLLDMLVLKLESLERSHKELKRKFNSLSLYKIVRGRHI